MKTTFGKIALRKIASCCANLPPDQIRLPGSHCWRDEEGGWMAARTSSGWIPPSWQKLYYYYKKGEGKAERDHQSNITYCAQISITFSRVSSFLCRMDGWVVVSQWKRWCRGLRIFPEQTLHEGLNTAKEKKSFPPSSHRNPFNSNRRQMFCYFCSFVVPYYYTPAISSRTRFSQFHQQQRQEHTQRLPHSSFHSNPIDRRNESLRPMIINWMLTHCSVPAPHSLTWPHHRRM